MCREGRKTIGQEEVCSFLLREMQQRESQARAHLSLPLPQQPSFSSMPNTKVCTGEWWTLSSCDIPLLRRPCVQCCLCPTLHSTSQSARSLHPTHLTAVSVVTSTTGWVCRCVDNQVSSATHHIHYHCSTRAGGGREEAALPRGCVGD